MQHVSSLTRAGVWVGLGFGTAVEAVVPHLTACAEWSACSQCPTHTPCRHVFNTHALIQPPPKPTAADDMVIEYVGELVRPSVSDLRCARAACRIWAIRGGAQPAPPHTHPSPVGACWWGILLLLRPAPRLGLLPLCLCPPWLDAAFPPSSSFGLLWCRERRMYDAMVGAGTYVFRLNSEYGWLGSCTLQRRRIQWCPGCCRSGCDTDAPLGWGTGARAGCGCRQCALAARSAAHALLPTANNPLALFFQRQCVWTPPGQATWHTC